MQKEYEQIKLIFQDQIMLSPFDPNKAINILTDGASSKGIGFVFYQHPDESNPSDDVTIVYFYIFSCIFLLISTYLLLFSTYYNLLT